MIRALIVCLILCLAGQAAAHTRSQAFSNWEFEDNQARFVYAVDALRITQLGALYPDQSDLSELLRLHVAETLSVTQNGQSCKLQNIEPLGLGQATHRVSGRVICPQDITELEAKVTLTAFFAVSPTHLHIARVANAGGSDHILREGRPAFMLSARAPPQSFWAFLTVGFHHVLSGLDHMVFLLGLALVARRPKLAILCISGFTLGHTASLGLSTFGLIVPDARWVEAIIGFTIAVMALEAGALRGLSRKQAFTAFALFTAAIAVFSPYDVTVLGLLLAVYVFANGQVSETVSQKLLPIITIAFGLIHGAGFAGGLAELQLSQDALWGPLIGFNLGVEAAQLLVLAIVYCGFYILARQKWASLFWTETAVSLCIFGLGVFWYAERLWT